MDFVGHADKVPLDVLEREVLVWEGRQNSLAALLRVAGFLDGHPAGGLGEQAESLLGNG